MGSLELRLTELIPDDALEDIIAFTFLLGSCFIIMSISIPLNGWLPKKYITYYVYLWVLVSCMPGLRFVKKLCLWLQLTISLYEHKNLPHYRVRCSFSSLCLSSSNFPSSHHFSIIPSIWKQPDYGSFVENEFWCYMVVWVLFSFISVFIVHACCPHYYVVTQVVVGMPLILLMV